MALQYGPVITQNATGPKRYCGNNCLLLWFTVVQDMLLSLSLLKTFELQNFKNGLFAMSYWSEALRALLSERNDLRIRGGPEFEVAHFCPSQSKVAMPKSRCAWMLWFDKLRWPTMQDSKETAQTFEQSDN